MLIADYLPERYWHWEREENMHRARCFSKNHENHWMQEDNRRHRTKYADLARKANHQALRHRLLRESQEVHHG